MSDEIGHKYERWIKRYNKDHIAATLTLAETIEEVFAVMYQLLPDETKAKIERLADGMDE